MSKNNELKETPDYKELLEKAKQEKDNFSEIFNVRLIVNDVTSEKLICLLQQNNEKIAFISSEGGVFRDMLGRYSKDASNIDIYLEGYDGGKLSVDRIGRPTIELKEPLITFCVFNQPVTISEFLENKMLRERGMHARFLYSVPNSKIGFRNISFCKADEVVWQKNFDKYQKKYNENIKKILNLELKEKISLTLNSKAQEASDLYGDAVEKKLVGELESLRDWGNKLHGNVLRLAALLQVAKTIDKNNNSDSAPITDWIYDEIEEKTFNDAKKLGDYFESHTKAVYGSIGDSMILGCKYVLQQLRKKEKQTEIKKRDLFRACRGKFSIVSEIEPILGMLCEHGYLREYVPEKDTRRPGKNPDKIYLINPHVYDNG